MTRTTEQIEAFFASVLAVQPHRAFGLQLAGWGPGNSHLFFDPSPAGLGANGEVHGGVLSLLLEPAALFALFSQLPANRYAVTVDTHIQFLKAANPSRRIDLYGSVVRMGRQLAFCEAKAMQGETLCVQARVTKAVIPG